MAITEDRQLALPSGEPTRPRNEQPPLGVFERPTTATGWRSWVTTVDHKKIGIMYGVVALFFMFVGGFEALLIRAQLATPKGTLLSADTYNQVFTMHAITMIFLFVMPMASAFANYLIPLQIGARDVAFPRLNALSLWIYVFGAIFLGCQVYEFWHFVHDKDLTITNSILGTTFYTLTGTHGLHVLIGVIWLVSMYLYSFTGRVGEKQAINVETMGLYWHFVDIVWIVIFTAVYLLEYL